MRDQFFEFLANEFSQGKLFDAAKRFNYPAAVYIGDRALVYCSPKEMGDALQAYKNRLADFEYRKTNAKVFAMTPKRGDKQIFWVNYRHCDKAGDEIEQTSIKYFCCDASDGGFRIQLAEYIVSPSVCTLDGEYLENSRAGIVSH